jgi:hypothetical protein
MKTESAVQALNLLVCQPIHACVFLVVYYLFDYVYTERDLKYN